MTCAALSWASRTPAQALSAPTMTFSMTDSPANGLTSWKVRPTPARQIWSGRQPSMRLPREAHLAGIGAIDAGDDIEAGGLAGAVGPDQPDDGALGDGQADILHGAQAAEALGHLVELEQRGHLSPLSPLPGARCSPSALLQRRPDAVGQEHDDEQQAEP